MERFEVLAGEDESAVKQKVQLSPTPEAILRVYRRIFRQKSMDNFNIENFWQQEQSKKLQELEYSTEKYHVRRREIWQNLVIVIATILGFSLGLTSIYGGEPSLLLQITWVLQIVIITFGFFLLIIENEINLKRGRASFKFSYDMSEIRMMESRGEFVTNKELKSGLFISAIDKFNKTIPSPDKSELWTPYAKKLIKKYSPQLPSNKLFVTKDKNTFDRLLVNWVSLSFNKLSFGFFFLIVLSFIFLLLAIFS